MWDAVVPFVASMPPTANMAPTVALRGRVRGLWSRGRCWGKRWYFIPSIRRRWHSTLSRRSVLLSRSARNYRHMQKKKWEKKAKASTCRIMWQLQLEYMEGTRMCYISMGVGTCWLRCYRWLRRFKSQRRLLSLIERLDEIRPTTINALSHTKPRTHWSSDTLEN